MDFIALFARLAKFVTGGFSAIHTASTRSSVKLFPMLLLVPVHTAVDIVTAAPISFHLDESVCMWGKWRDTGVSSSDERGQIR